MKNVYFLMAFLLILNLICYTWALTKIIHKRSDITNDLDVNATSEIFNKTSL